MTVCACVGVSVAERESEGLRLRLRLPSVARTGGGGGDGGERNRDALSQWHPAEKKGVNDRAGRLVSLLAAGYVRAARCLWAHDELRK